MYTVQCTATNKPKTSFLILSVKSVTERYYGVEEDLSVNLLFKQPKTQHTSVHCFQSYINVKSLNYWITYFKNFTNTTKYLSNTTKYFTNTTKYSKVNCVLSFSTTCPPPLLFSLNLKEFFFIPLLTLTPF